MRKNSLDMTEGPILRKMIAFMIPLLANKMLNSFYSTADKMVLGRFVGDAAMAACGVTTAPFGLIYNLFSGISLGVTVCCGNLLGARKHAELKDCMHTSICTALILAAVTLSIGLPLSHNILLAVGAPAELMEEALLYFRVRFLGTPISMCNAFMLAIMSAHGDTRRQVYIGAFCGLCNVLLNLLFVLVIPMGIFGVALATIVSDSICLIWRASILFSSREEYGLQLRKLRIKWRYFWDVLRVGVPNGLNLTVFKVANVLLQSTINSFGALYITANTIADSVEDYAGLAYACVPSACITAVAQCYGAKNYDRIDKVMRCSLLCCHVGVTFCSAIVLIFARPLLGMFTTSPEVVEAAVPKVVYYSVGYFIHTFGQIYVAGIKGLKKTSVALILNIFSICVPRIAWVLFIVPLWPTPNVLYLIYPVSWAISSTFLGIGYYHYRNKLRSDSLPAAA